MAKKLLITIILILIGCASVTFGLISCASTNNQESAASQTQGTGIEELRGMARTAAAVQRGPLASLLIPDIDAERGIQKSLDDKSGQVLNVWESLKLANGVINILMSAGTGNSESLYPVDNILKKLSNKLSFAFSVLLFSKLLLMVSNYMIFLVVIPACSLIIIILLWTCKERKRLPGLVFTVVLSGLTVLFAVPLAFELSSLLDNKLLSQNVNTLVSSIDENGKTAAGMERSAAASGRQGNINQIINARELGSSIIEDVNNYYIIFLFVYLIIPVLFITGLIFLIKYIVGLVLGKQQESQSMY